MIVSCAQRSRRRLVFCVALAGLVLAGCAAQQPAPGEAEEPADIEAQAAEAEELLDAGRPLAAAGLYDNMASATDGVESMRWRIQAAETLLDNGYDNALLEQQRRFRVIELPARLEVRRRIIDARAAVVRRQSALALGLLPDDVAGQPRAVRARFHETRAQALSLEKQTADALAAYIEADRVFRARDDSDAVERVHDATWSLLNTLDRDDREELATALDGDTARGWAELAVTESRASTGREPVDTAFDDWLQRYPEHPAADFADQLRKRVIEQLTYPQRIDVLLPLSGPLADTARAIRDGMITAYFGIPGYVTRPDIVFHDVGADGLTVAAAYEQAAAAGAEFIVGPLRRSSVSDLAELDDRELPVLALNYLAADRDEVPEQFHQFGLRPEDEARQTAEAAIQDNRFNAVSLTPASEWGDRLQAAFRDRFEELGGVVVSESGYNPEQSDYRRPIQRLLNIDDSRTRFSRLRSTLGASEINFEPRRRQDMDVIFLAAEPRQGRLAKPQLEFHRIGETPVYATSAVFSGEVDADSDWDMNGLFFTEIPWLLDRIVAGEDAGDAIAEQWPEQHGSFPRLFALGADAIDVLPMLDQLRAGNADHHRGRTGRLTVTEDGRVRRELDWARFTRGRPQPVPTPGTLPADRMLGEAIRERANEPD